MALVVAPFPSVEGNLLDGTCKAQGFEGLLATNGRGLAAAHATHKMLQLGMEWLDIAGVDFLDQAILAIEHLAIVGGVVTGGLSVNGDVVVEKIRLRHGVFAMGHQAANFMVGNLASGQGGNHAVRKAQRRRYVVQITRGCRTIARCRYPHDGRVVEIQKEVNVVDHQIEDNRDVVGPLGIRAHAMGLNGEDLLGGKNFAQFLKSWIEPLDMTDLQDALGFCSSIHQRFGLFDASGDRFFNQNVNACLKACKSYGMMETGGYGDANRIDMGKQLVVILEETHPIFARNAEAASHINIGNSIKLDILEQTQNARVVLAHIAHADDAQTNWAPTVLGLCRCNVSILHAASILHHARVLVLKQPVSDRRYRIDRSTAPDSPIIKKN